MYVFLIYDTVSEDWSSPFCAKNLEHLKRVLQGVFKQGLVLNETYVTCIAKLHNDGYLITDDCTLSIFENGSSQQYLCDLFADELEKLDKKEVKENG